MPRRRHMKGPNPLAGPLLRGSSDTSGRVLAPTATPPTRLRLSSHANSDPQKTLQERPPVTRQEEPSVTRVCGGSSGNVACHALPAFPSPGRTQRGCPGLHTPSCGLERGAPGLGRAAPRQNTPPRPGPSTASPGGPARAAGRRRGRPDPQRNTRSHVQAGHTIIKQSGSTSCKTPRIPRGAPQKAARRPRGPWGPGPAAGSEGATATAPRGDGSARRPRGPRTAALSVLRKGKAAPRSGATRRGDVVQRGDVTRRDVKLHVVR